MKRVFSLILAALISASLLTACGNKYADETSSDTAGISAETVETSETDEVKTPSLLITENGMGTAKIVLSANADQLEAYAAEELRYHIEKVSGASVDIVTGKADGALPVIITSLESDPSLAERFPEDIRWLTTLEEGEKRWGSDGFAIRRSNGALYIFGATPRGALNGVYDFIEENLGVLWIGADEATDLVYEEMPTITVLKVDYREKSPFEVRGWVASGRFGGPEMPPSEILYSRNKLNTSNTCIGMEGAWEGERAIGQEPVMVNHYMKHWITTSPLYDSECTEYMNKKDDGTIIPFEEHSQINFWSDITRECLTESVLAYLRTSGADNVAIGMEDNDTCPQYPECTLPFEYAPGQFVNPGDHDYLSTVYYTFLNKVADRVAEEFPHVTVNTFAYWILEA
ncbi:MAG: hypothetical protein E7638_08175, partial [Ruminococcaceae bacterium]|nr:hypothetical protein [Oscillospiraceae bacterium]